MLEKNDLLGVIEAHAQNIRLVNILRVLTLKGDLSKSFYEIIGEEAAKSPSFIKTFQLLENTDKVIHTVEQLYWMTVRSSVTECFELTHDYCEKTKQDSKFKNQSWFYVIRTVRNALNHNFLIEFKYENDRKRLPIQWKEIRIDISMENQILSHKIFPVSAALEWLETLENFINDELM